MYETKISNLMEVTFIKTIQGHQLNFFKQDFPSSYRVSPKHIEHKEIFLSLEKDDKGFWNVKESEHLPGWFNEISMHVHHAIEEFETKGPKRAGFQEFGYLF